MRHFQKANSRFNQLPMHGGGHFDHPISPVASHRTQSHFGILPGSSAGSFTSLRYTQVVYFRMLLILKRFQDHPFQPLTHPSAGGNISNLCAFASLHGLFIRGLYMLLSPNPQPSPGTLVESLLIQPSEGAGMELHDLGEMGEKVRQAVIAEVKVVLVLHVFFA